MYRNERLLLAGDWLGLGFQKEEHYKLARIAMDTPTSLDQPWHIDVRKSRCRPPGPLRDDLKRIARVTRNRAPRSIDSEESSLLGRRQRLQSLCGLR